MKSLYAPWRNPYSQSIEQPKADAQPDACIFCTLLNDNQDQQHFILKRLTHTAIMFNRYPYNAGHLLIVPYNHVNSLASMSAAARAECMEAAQLCTAIIQDVMKPNGFNIGFNFGKAAGAGIPEHAHLHVLPRWTGDTNFLPTLGQTKTISMDLVDLYARLKPRFDAVSVEEVK
jgi:ATP adenylyltransferase